MEYKHTILDFIDRTLMILDQYNDMKACIGKEHAYEVTLLMNCLMGLLVVPQQLGNQKDYQADFQKWLTDEYVSKNGEKWGIDPEWILSPGFYSGNAKQDKQVKSVEDLTMKNLLRQMRNAATHVNISLCPMDSGIEEIQYIEFRELKKNPKKEDEGDELFRPNGFRMKIPVEGLDNFVRLLADATAEKVVAMNNNNLTRSDKKTTSIRCREAK